MSCYDAPPLLDDLAPAPAHALFEGERKDLLYAGTHLRRALDVLRVDLARDGHTLFGGDWRLTLGAQHALRLFVSPQVGLGRDKDDRYALTEVRYLRIPLRSDDDAQVGSVRR